MLISDLLSDKITSSFLRLSLHLYTVLHVSQESEKEKVKRTTLYEKQAIQQDSTD